MSDERLYWASQRDQWKRDTLAVTTLGLLWGFVAATGGAVEQRATQRREEIAKADASVSAAMDGAPDTIAGWTIGALEETKSEVWSALESLRQRARDGRGRPATVGQLMDRRVDGQGVSYGSLREDRHDLRAMRDTFGGLYWRDFREFVSSYDGLFNERRRDSRPAEVVMEILAREGLLTAVQVPPEEVALVGPHLAAAVESLEVRYVRAGEVMVSIDALLEWDPGAAELSVGMTPELATRIASGVRTLGASLGRSVAMEEGVEVVVRQLREDAKGIQATSPVEQGVEAFGVRMGVPLVLARAWFRWLGLPFVVLISLGLVGWWRAVGLVMAQEHGGGGKRPLPRTEPMFWLAAVGSLLVLGLWIQTAFGL